MNKQQLINHINISHRKPGQKHAPILGINLIEVYEKLHDELHEQNYYSVPHDHATIDEDTNIIITFEAMNKIIASMHSVADEEDIAYEDQDHGVS